MSKFIIDNQSSLIDSHSMAFVLQVMAMGKISGREGKAQHCYYSEHQCGGKVYGVSVFRNKASERFVIIDVEPRGCEEAAACQSLT